MFQPRAQRNERALDLLAVLATGLAAFALLAGNLSHPALHNWDEALHQAAARGTADTFFRPYLYVEHLEPHPLEHWWASDTWLHKPVGPLWATALVMKVIGVTPLAMRLVSFVCQSLTAVLMFFLGRRLLLSRLTSFAAAFSFLALPFGWQLVNGEMFADVYDTTATTFVTASVWLLLRAIDRQTVASMALAGATLGLGYLCKTVLVLAPLGVAGLLWAGRLSKLWAGPRLVPLLAMGGAFVAVAAPWNLYAARTWPALYETGAKNTRGHLVFFKDLGIDVGAWKRPVDAVINEMVMISCEPIPHALLLLTLVTFAVVALKRRHAPMVAVAAWGLATLVAHTFTIAKPPGHLFTAVPALLLAAAWVAEASLKSPALAAVFAAGVLTRWADRSPQWVVQLRSRLSTDWLEQTRRVPGLVEGALLAALLLAVLPLGFVLLRRRRWVALALGVPCAVAFAGLFVVAPTLRQHELLLSRADAMATVHSSEVGPAIDHGSPRRSVVFEDFELDPPDTFEVHSLIFYSGRPVYREPPRLELAKAKGFHPLLVTPAAEPYAEVPGQLPHAWLRAYDLLAPGPMAPVPAGAAPLQFEVDGLKVKGVAAGDREGGRDAWVFFVEATGAPVPLQVEFWGESTAAPLSVATIAPEASLRRAGRLQGAAWYLAPVLGPQRRRVTRVRLGSSHHEVRLWVEPGTGQLRAEP